MPAWKYLATSVCAAALALGLAACEGGGGGGGSSPQPDAAAMERAEAVATELEAAGATGADGGFDDGAHMVSPTVTATNDGMAVTIAVMETGTPRGGTARAGEFAEQEDGPASIAGWAGARFRRGEAAEHLVVYSDVGAPVAMPFTVENLNRLSEVSGLADGALDAPGLGIEAGYFAVIRATSLEAAPPRGSVTYGPTGTGADEGLSFTGTFSGASGAYSCSGSACSATLDDRGAPTALGGDWTFAPDEGAMVRIPDYDHMYFGWWLNEQEDASGFQSFVDAVGFPAGAGAVEAAMEGSATYRGAAAGVWATVDISGGQVTAAESGEFTAEATLTANFFGAQDAGAVSGEIGNFRDGSGRSLSGWRVTLNAAGLAVGEAGFAGETGGTLGSGSVGAGNWEGRFHGSDGAETNARPSHATGRFDLHFPGAHLAGAFGAGR